MTLALGHGAKQRIVTIMVLSEASPFKAKKVINQMEDLPESWFDPFIRYLSKKALPKGKKITHTIVNKLRNYFLQENKIYRKMSLGPGLFCVTSEVSHNLLRLVHGHGCRSHSNGRKLS